MSGSGNESDLPNGQIPSGSSLYYALRFAPTARQRGLVILATLWRTLETIPSASSDPMVARTKLQWWQEQLSGQLDSSPHPLLEAWRKLDLSPSLAEHYRGLICSLLEQVDNPTPDSAQAMLGAAEAVDGCLTGALSQHLGAGGEELEVATAIGSYLGVSRQIRDLGRLLHQGRNPLPADLLQKASLTPADLLLETSDHPLGELLGQTERDQREALAHRLSPLPPKHYPALGCALALLHCRVALMDELRQEGFRVTRQRTSIPPLRTLWLARKAHWQARWTRTALTRKLN